MTKDAIQTAICLFLGGYLRLKTTKMDLVSMAPRLWANLITFNTCQSSIMGYEAPFGNFYQSLHCWINLGLWVPSDFMKNLHSDIWPKWPDECLENDPFGFGSMPSYAFFHSDYGKNVLGILRCSSASSHGHWSFVQGPWHFHFHRAQICTLIGTQAAIN